MAEPTHNLPDEDKPDIRPSLRALEGQDDKNSGEFSNKEAAQAIPSEQTGSNDKSVSREDLASAEASGDDQTLGAGYNPNDSKRGLRARSWLRRNRRPVLIGGGVAGGLAGSLVGILFILAPLKIEHIVTNLQNHFMATSESAIQTQTQKMFTEYVEKHVIPGYNGKCKTTIDSRCSALSPVGNNPVSNMYKSWSQAKLENKLATDYNIEFKKNTANNRWYLKAPGTDVNGDDIGVDGSKLSGEFQRADRSTMRSAFSNAMENETKWKKMYYHFKVGRLLDEKYGIKRCIMFCGIKDQLADHVDAQKNAAKIYFTQRVIQPRNESLGIVLECLINGCNPEDTQPVDSTSGTGELNNEPENPDTDSAIRTKLVSLASTYGIVDESSIDQMLKDYKDISDKGLDRYVLDKIMTKLGLAEFSQNVADAVPVIGWVNFAANLITHLHNAGPALKKLTYLTNATAAVSMYMMYRSYADEIHTGHVNATEAGSMTESLNPDPSNPNNTGDVTSAPLYKAVIDKQSADLGTVFAPSSLLGTKAFAASTTSNTGYTCKNGAAVPQGKLVCPEEKFGQGSGALSAISGFFDLPGISVITAVASAISHVTGVLSSVLGTIISHVPGVGSLQSLVSDKLQPLFKFVIQQLIPNPFSDTSAPRNFDMMAGGVDVVNHDSCESIGCKTVSAQAYNDIVNQQEQQRQQQFVSSSLFARMFNTGSPDSLISRVALSMPTNIQGLAGSFVGSLRSPFTTLSHGFSSIFSTRASAADSSLSEDPFGVTQTAFPANEIPDDPESAWTRDHCDDTSQNGPVYQWQKAAAGTADDINGMPVHQTTEPCLLMQATVGSAGGFFDSSLLSADDLATGDGSPTVPSSTAGTSIDTGTLYKSSVSVACANGTRDLGVQDGYYQGQKVEIRICAVPNLPSTGEESNGGYGVTGANGQAIVNSVVSGAVYAMVSAADQAGVKLAAISSFRTMAHQEALCPCDGVTVARPGFSNHQMGLAIDFGGGLPSTPGPVPGNQFWEWLSTNASKFGYKNYVNEAWHWSPTGN